MASHQDDTSNKSKLAKFHENMMRHCNGDVFKKYTVEQVLGQGSMGAVSKVRIRPDMVGGSAFHPKAKGVFGFLKPRRHNRVNTEGITVSEDDYVYALKSIIVDKVSCTFLDELQNEISILRTLDHPNIVRLYEVYMQNHTRSAGPMIYMVLELCDGGDLYTRGPYSEYHAAKYTAQLVSAILYMHEHGVVHRDLKYENIMFENKETNSAIKVIDFGLSKKFMGSGTGEMYERVGTIYTMAPQVLQGIYTSQADLWSIGVITFMLLSSTKPFYSKHRRRMMDLIIRADYNFLAPVWKVISIDGKDFVSKLLVVDPKKRMTADEATNHPWIKNRDSLKVKDMPSEDLYLTPGINDSLLHYKHTSELKKLALNVIAHRSSTKDILYLRRAFEKVDSQTKTNGVITFEEFQQALESTNFSPDVLQQIFASIDVNQNGHIDYTEFLAATIEAHGAIAENRIAEAFDRLDADNTGFISKQDLREVLGDDAEQIDAILKQCDTDRDGEISYQEFLAAFREHTSTNAKNMILADNVDSGDTLEGLDSKIPGGRHDTQVDGDTGEFKSCRSLV